MCTLKIENKICWSFYVFFDLVVTSSVLTTLYVYCSIVDFIERYFQKCLVKQKKLKYCRDANLANSSNLSKSS